MSRRSAVGSGLVLGFAVLIVVSLVSSPASAQGCSSVTSCVDNTVGDAPCGVDDIGKCCILDDPCQSCPTGQSAHCNDREQCVGNLANCPNGHFCGRDADCASGFCIDGTCQVLSPAPALSRTVFAVLAVLLTATGWLVLRRRARE